MCNSETETAHHLFMECNFAKLVWFSSSLGFHVPLHSSLSSWLGKKDKLGSQLFCTILWKMWFYRNQTVFKLVNTFPPDVATAAIDFVVDFNQTVPAKKSKGQQSIAAAPSPVQNAHIIQVVFRRDTPLMAACLRLLQITSFSQLAKKRS